MIEIIFSCIAIGISLIAIVISIKAILMVKKSKKNVKYEINPRDIREKKECLKTSEGRMALAKSFN